MKKPLLLGCKGCGNAIVEARFAVAGLPLDYEEVDYSDDSPTRPRLLQVNPLGQVPTLVLPSGEVMTESLAMLHYIDDLAPKAGLIPPKGDPLRPVFYRWAVFLIAAVSIPRTPTATIRRSGCRTTWERSACATAPTTTARRCGDSSRRRRRARGSSASASARSISTSR
jgi:glutathione S-transferase